MKKDEITVWVIRILLTLLLGVAMLATWPGYAVYDTYCSTTNSYGCDVTEPLASGERIAQYFVPQSSVLDCIEIAFQYNEDAVLEEALEFELYRASGESVLKTTIPMKQIPNGGYFGIEIGKRVKAGESYYWSVTSPQKESCGLIAMYTTNVANQAVENTYVTINEELFPAEAAQTVSQYVYRIHPSKVVILAKYWTVYIIIWLICLELVDRFRAKYHKS